MKEIYKKVYIAYDGTEFATEEECEHYEYNAILEITSQFEGRVMLLSDVDNKIKQLTPAECITYVQQEGHILIFKFIKSAGIKLASRYCDIMNKCDIVEIKNNGSDNIFTSADTDHIVTFTYDWEYSAYYRDKEYLDQKIETLSKMRDECIAAATRANPEG